MKRQVDKRHSATLDTRVHNFGADITLSAERINYFQP